ncbi:hypothetical protein JVT61DRAFT_10759 [Boletus reticuloceps]|uniref:Uncharacterized protein n=1 Tax=Boletus reticuloceps TaxID=495285 RepID=A0A8I2YFR5_9AGAM|nr:hypothetical protein JVT61DRAFT_10759 [Boletus reticuloceps]
MLLLVSTDDRDGLQQLAIAAEKKGANNLAFATFFQLGDTKALLVPCPTPRRCCSVLLTLRMHFPDQLCPELRTCRSCMM